MPDPVQTPPTSAPVAAEAGKPGSVANNIVKGITDKANGKAPAATTPTSGQPPANASADPNAGKEKYVVNGKEVWLTPDQRTAYIQKGIAFEPQVDQLRRLQTETQAFLNDLKNDPAKILFDKRLGHTPESVFENIMKSAKISDAIKDKVGQWYYENAVEPLKLTPEQLKAREDAKYRAEREQQDASAKDQMIKQENQRRVDMAMNQIKANIAEAMKDSGLPSNDTPLGAEMARMVADTMRLAHSQRQIVTPKQAIEYVKTRIKSVQSAWYDHLDEESLVKELGEKNAEKVKKYFLKLVKEAEKQPITNTARKVPERNGRKIINSDDFHDYLAEIKKKG